MLAVFHWDGEAGNGLWSDPLNWDRDSLPGSADDVVIDMSVPTAVVAQGVFVQSVTLGGTSTAEQKLTADGVVGDAFQVSGEIQIHQNGVFKTTFGTYVFVGEPGGAPATLKNEGLLSVDLYSRVFVSGGFEQTPTGHLQLALDGGEIGGLVPLAFGQVNVDGNASIAGSLDLRPGPFFDPPSGASLNVLTYDTYQGSFSAITGLVTPAGIPLNPTYSAREFSLVVPGSVSGTDLVPTAFSVVASDGVSEIAVSWTVRNDGPADVSPDPGLAWFDEVRFSFDATLSADDSILGSYPHISEASGFAVGGTYTNAKRIPLPLVDSGFLILRTDVTGVLSDPELGNNSLTIPFQVAPARLPDLEVSPTTSPSSADPGEKHSGVVDGFQHR